MRVSERMRYDKAIARVDNARTSNMEMMDVISTQKRINRISDDPIGVSRTIREKAVISDFKQLQKNVEFSKGFLERSESAISGIHEKLIRAKEIAIALSNSTYNQDSRAAAAREIKEIIKEVRSLANTTYLNRQVFSGFRTETPSLDEYGNFIGDDGSIFLQIDPHNHHQININARNLFEVTPEEFAKKHVGIMGTIELLHDGLVNNDRNALYKSMEELDFNMEKTSSYEATVGARSKALADASERMSQLQDQSADTVSKIEDADLYQASSDFKRTETLLQATLMASNKLLQPSLMNFIQ
jgi:flagellar hook-associated protein 3 FlgL